MNSAKIQPITSIDHTVNRYIYIGYWDYVHISDDEYTLHREYGQFTGFGDSDTISRRILSYNRRALVGNRPLYNSMLKDVQRLPFVFVDPVAEFIPLVTIHEHIVGLGPTDIHDFARDVILDRLIRVTHKHSCQEVQDTHVIDYGAGPVTVNDGSL